ncbi:MAG TPA: hypothetical protein VLG27_01630 [Candidatus Saccharimonadia bacterium]|nr:hypothetical protein [Candidatus Saccharimonadia bacterium]
MAIWKLLRHVHLIIPEELLAEVDYAAAQHYMSRSEYVRRVLAKEVGGRFPGRVERVRKENFVRFLDAGDS